jgi:lysine biosynthesis protein LysW
MSKTYCPSCDAVVSVDKPRLGDMVICRECDTKLEIISTDPFELDFPLDYDDDWDDDWDDEDR